MASCHDSIFSVTAQVMFYINQEMQVHSSSPRSCRRRLVQVCLEEKACFAEASKIEEGRRLCHPLGFSYISPSPLVPVSSVSRYCLPLRSRTNDAGRSRGKRSAAHKTWLVSSAEVAAAWAAAINDALRRSYLNPALKSKRAIGPGRRLLVLINPVSGTGGSLTAWKNTLRCGGRYGSWRLFSRGRGVCLAIKNQAGCPRASLF